MILFCKDSLKLVQLHLLLDLLFLLGVVGCNGVRCVFQFGKDLEVRYLHHIEWVIDERKCLGESQKLLVTVMIVDNTERLLLLAMASIHWRSSNLNSSNNRSMLASTQHAWGHILSLLIMMDELPTNFEVLQQLLTQFPFDPIEIQMTKPILQFGLLLLSLFNP